MRIEFTLTDEDGESYSGSAELSRVKASARRPLSPQRPKAIKTLPDHVMNLRNLGFFHEPRTGNEVHAKLLKVYHCQLNRVQMALLRFVRRRELRKTAKDISGKKQVAYVS